MKKQDILHLLKLKTHSSNESSTSFDFVKLMKDVHYKETDTHLYVYNFPSAYGDTQNKNNRIYEQSSLKAASDWFNEVHKENPYFGYIFDGHRDEDSYENIVGRILNLKIDESSKCILSDLKLNKGAKSFNTIANIIKDGDPIGISMRIISPNTLYLSKNEIEQVNEDVNWLSDDNAGISELMGKDEDIEYISGNAYIQRFDLTWFPSFNKTYISKASGNKSESFRMKEYTQTSCLISNKDRCITDSCRFRNTVKDFIDLISKDESITTIKDHPNLYDDMLKFSYMNLSEFNFDSISDSKYLARKLNDFKLDANDADKQIATISEMTGKDNLLNYISKENRIDVDKYILMLNSIIMKVIDVDEVFYQVITTNYLHQIILSTILLFGKEETPVMNVKAMADKLEETADNNDDNNDILIQLIKEMKSTINVYDFTNLFFTYLYSHVERFSSMAAPAAVISESFNRFKRVSTKKLFTKSFVK